MTWGLSLAPMVTPFHSELSGGYIPEFQRVAYGGHFIQCSWAARALPWDEGPGTPTRQLLTLPCGNAAFPFGAPCGEDAT